MAFLKDAGSCRAIGASRHGGGPDGLTLDVCDARQLAEALRQVRPDVILHFAGNYSTDFEQAFAANVNASRLLLEAVQQQGLRTRVVLVGSAAEYGAVQPEENPIREDHALNPVSLYGLTKAWQSQLARLYALRGADVLVARIFNAQGPGISEQLFIGRVQQQIDAVLSGRQSEIRVGPLSAVRDYISTAEAARQVAAIAACGESGEVYHVASGVPVTMREVLARQLARHGLDFSLVQEAAEFSNRTGYDVPAIYADTTKTARVLAAFDAAARV